MKPYLLSLGAGLIIGVVYSLLNVKSPAPPVVALVGLLGILLGEQIVPAVRHVMASQPTRAAVTGVRYEPELGRLSDHAPTDAREKEQV